MQSDFEAKFHDGFYFLLERHLAGVEAEVWVCGGFEGCADAGEVLHFASAGACIEAFHVAALTLLERRGDIHFAKVFLANNLASHLS